MFVQDYFEHSSKKSLFEVLQLYLSNTNLSYVLNCCVLNKQQRYPIFLPKGSYNAAVLHRCFCSAFNVVRSHWIGTKVLVVNGNFYTSALNHWEPILFGDYSNKMLMKSFLIASGFFLRFHCDFKTIRCMHTKNFERYWIVQ